ncbi:DUF5703 family protein [Psychromicrobium xiongbiense]|uniref:DUF5703 family protein n=1 Tax=Psychromicrobium xiongbiense TaxID=3051184 RepID=UPI0025576185|nr:DUF5703 family protein [Psychromicrobium sp. YIM S02556]
MREDFRSRIPEGAVRRDRDLTGQYEYLVLHVSARESTQEARQRLTEHAEYGKWELQRSRLYVGGSRQFWLRRRVLRVERTA